MGDDPGATTALIGIVDDDPAVRNSLKFSLELEGLKVGVFASASELLDAPDLTCFQCLVVDYNMPGMDGLDLAAKLRQMQFAAPVILITSGPSRALIARAERAKVQIVEKPLLGNTLFEQIGEAIAASRRT